MIGYGETVWQSMSASGMWPLIAVAPQMRQISVYVAAEVGGVPLVEVFDGDLGRVRNGRTCVRFTRFANLNHDGMRALVRRAIAVAAQQDQIHGRHCAQPVRE